MRADTLLSLVVPVYNDSKSLVKCLSSIYKSEYRSYQVIVVNDGSTDDSLQVARSFDCTVIDLPVNKGVANARNVGADEASGDILVFIDSDVVIDPDTLSKFAAAHKNTDVEICTSQVYPASLSKGFAPELIAASWHYIIRKALPSPSSVSTMAFSINKKVFNEVGQFNTSFGLAGGEEFEIGVPIKSHGYKIHLDTSILVHHHYQSFWPRFKTVLRRSYVYGNIAYHHKLGFDKDQGTKIEVINTMLSLAGFFSILLCLFGGHYLAFFLISLILHVLVDNAFYTYLKNTKGLFFALRAIPVNFAWYFAAGLGAIGSVWSVLATKTGQLFSIPRLFFAETPPYVIFFVTSSCNANCKHCFSKAYPQSDMSLDEIDKISKSFKNINYLTYSGGEPSLRPDIVEITRCFYVNNNLRHLNFITNGFEPDLLLQQIEQILRLCPNMSLMISFSLDGIGKLHDEIRNYPGGFDRLMASIKRSLNLQNYYKQLQVSTITTYSKYNESSIFEIIEYVTSEIKVPCYLNYVRGDGVTCSVDGPDLDIYIKATSLVKSCNAKRLKQSQLFQAIHDLTAKLVAETKLKRKRVIPCLAGLKMIEIKSDGTVFPCEMLSLDFGKICDYQYDIKQIMRSEAALKYYDFLNQKQCYCTWECAMANNIIYSWRTYPRLLMELLKNFWSKE